MTKGTPIGEQEDEEDEEELAVRKHIQAWHQSINDYIFFVISTHPVITIVINFLFNQK